MVPIEVWLGLSDAAAMRFEQVARVRDGLADPLMPMLFPGGVRSGVNAPPCVVPWPSCRSSLPLGEWANAARRVERVLTTGQWDEFDVSREDVTEFMDALARTLRAALDRARGGGYGDVCIALEVRVGGWTPEEET